MEAVLDVVPRDLLGQDALGTLRSLPTWWELLLADRIDPAAQRGLDEQAAVLRRLTGSERGAKRPASLADIELLSREAIELIRGPSESAPEQLTVANEVAASLRVITETAAALRTGEVLGEGTVEGVFVSDGGVPKHPLPSTSVVHRGLIGDRQEERRHHGRVWQAVCVWSAEVVERLGEEGHPIHAGAAGENVSLRGIDWKLARPGTRLHLGPDVVLELSLPALPCYKNAQWFIDGEFNRMHHEREWGISRMYASVVTEGRLTTGDDAILIG